MMSGVAHEVINRLTAQVQIPAKIAISEEGAGEREGGVTGFQRRRAR